jgi:hypothetical protein
MPPKFYKHKLLLDEGLFKRQSLRRVNSRHNLKHIKHDLHKGGVSDTEVYEIACREKRIIVTYNVDDFKKLVKQNKETGVIGIAQGITPDQLDTKLNALLSKHSENSFYGKYTPLGK